MPLRRLTTALMTAITLVLGLVVVTMPPAMAGDSEYGRAWRNKDGVLPQDGTCREYTFQYRVKPGNVHPGGDWGAEFFLLDRKGNNVASDAKDASVDPKRGSGVFKLCDDTSTVPGRFKIRGRLTVYPPDDGGPHTPLDPPLVGTSKWIKPGYFRLRRP